MAEPIGTAVAEKVVENLVDRISNSILNSITVVRKCNENVQNLKTQVEALENKKGGVKRYIEHVGRRGDEIDEEVPAWLTKADEFIKAAEEPLRVGDEFAKNECFFRLCPNPRPRYKLSKKAEQITRDIANHVQEAHRFDPPPFHAPPPQQDVAGVVEGFEEFPSRMAVLEQIMEALRNPIVNTIGVHGTSGVGKTMLVKMVKGIAKQDSLFTAVVMTKVTKNPDLTSIQRDIARDLRMDLLPTELPPPQVADRLKAKLMKERKFLVILDDVWDTEIDFEKFGIPSASEMKQAMEKKNEESSSRQADMLCKILLTSRFHNVLSGMMGERDQVFEVHELEDDEAWHLFKKIVGSKVERSDLQPIAKEIVKKCLGLPVAIASVGKAMKGKTQQFEWEDALAELKKPSPDGISAAVYKPIELSYRYLQGDELKQTFMLCSLLGHDSSINDLLKYAMGLNLFPKVKTVEETRNKVRTLVHSLKLSSLLVDGHSNMHFGMHDQIREVALSIASRDHGVLALVGEDGGEDWPEKETMENLEWIYLSNGYPELMSNGLKCCPRLTLFHLSNKGSSLAVPTDLFTGTEGLKVLCLTKIDFQSMPSEIPLIPTKLKTLLLDQCVFRVEALGAIMGNLENLEVLSLAGCAIEELPREVEKLTKLKLLDVSDCTKLKVIPRQVLARLSKLEELKMGNSFDQWDGVEEGNARLAELTELRMLTALEVRIPNFRDSFFPENLERFKIFIGKAKRNQWENRHRYSWDSNSWSSSFESSKIMKLKLQGAIIKSNVSVKKLLKETEELYLEGLNGVQGLVDELDDEGFQHLKCLHVQNAPDIRGIFNPARRLLPSHGFPILEVLTLFKLEKMEKICHGLTGAAHFKELRKITVYGCPQLKNLFSFSMARQLQLEEITVESCDNIEEIIIDDVEEQGNGNDIVEESEGCKLDGSLRSLTLDDLPKLISFNSSNRSNNSLFNDKFLFPNLEELQLSRINVDTIWIASNRVENLMKLIIHGYDNLKYLFSSAMARSLVKLGHLEIKNCNMMTQILSKENKEEKANLIFLELKFLLLVGLQNLVSFYSGDSTIEFSSLNELIVSDCSKFKGFAVMSTNTDVAAGIQPLFNKQVVFPNLEELRLFEIKINQLWITSSYVVTSQESFNFRKLKSLEIHECSSLEYLFTPSMVPSLVQLEELYVQSCQDLKQVIMAKGVEEVVNTELIFPRLNSIRLWCCDKLSSFYAGSYALKFQSAIKINIYNCPNMITFASTFSTEQEKETTYGGTEVRLGKKEPNIHSRTLFYEKVDIPLLDDLYLSSICVQKIWNSQITSMSSFVRNLRKLTLWNCDGLKYLFTSSIVKSLEQLEVLNIRGCKEMQVVILIEELGEKEKTSQTMFPKLDNLELSDLPQLVRFCSNCNSQGLNGSGSQVLAATQSNLMETEVTQLVFPQIHITKWPLLKRMYVGQCVKMKTFASEFLSNEKTYGDNHHKRQIQDPMFWISQDSFPCLERLEISKCHGLENLVSYSTAKSMELLKRLSITDCDLVEEIVKCLEDNVKDGIVFSQLKSLQLRGLPKLSSFCIRKCDFEFPSLKEVTVIGCPQMKYFSMGKTVAKELQNVQWINDEEEDGHWVGDLNSTIQDLFTQKGAYFGFERLKLSDSSELIQIWKRNSEELTLPFKKLQSLEVNNCSTLSYLLTPSMVLRLVQLKYLKVKDCAAIEQVIMATKVGEVVESDSILFPQLKSISLESCSELSSFYVGSKTLKFPMLEKIIVEDCLKMVRFASKFSSEQEKETIDGRSEEILVRKEPSILIEASFCDKVEFPNLKLLKLSSNNINQIWDNQISENPSIKNLKELVVEGYGTLKYLLTSSIVESFQQLTVLKICGCKMMEGIIVIQQLEEEKRMRQIFFPKLDSLVLQELPKLTRFCSENFCEFPSLTKLTISKCSMLKTFISGSAIGNMTLSTENEVNALPSLFHEKVKFPNLKLLKLSSLNINQIWNKNHEKISSFKKLQHLEVCNCSSLSYLLTPSMALGLVQLQDLTIKDCETMEQVIMAVGVVEVVETGLIFPQLNYILLESCSKLSSFYVGSNTLKFPMLKTIIVKNCLKRVRFTSKFPSAKEKKIADGRSEEVHVKEELDIFIEAFFCGEVEIPNLKTLTLFSINTKQIWNSQLSSISSFVQNLTKLKVVNSSNFKYLFTFSMVKSLVQLKELRISRCEMMEVVILIEGTVEEEKICQTVFPKLETLTLDDLPQLATFCSNCDSLGKISDSERVNFDTRSQELLATQSTLVETEATKLVFSQVTELMLRLLPKFKSFFPQTHITKWPSLESLVVIECQGAQIVASEISSTEMTHGDSQLERESQHLMFWISKATFPRLKRLVVKWNANIKIQCGHYPEVYFGKLKVLHLLGFPKQSAFLLPFFFHSLRNLKELHVKDAFFDEIFQCEEVTDEEKPVCGRTPLRKLRLSKLHELTHLWKEESQLEEDILRNLEILKVQECSRLKNLVPSTVYFNNLCVLEVSECHGLVNLVRYSTAKSLGQLRRMKVANCEMIEEIVACSGDAVEDGIVFPSLIFLQLKGLPRLESFCSGDCDFKFPHLKGVIVTECPNMQIFSKGELSTPKLEEVELTGDIYERWDQYQYWDKDIDEDMEKRIDDIFNKDIDERSSKFLFYQNKKKDEGSWHGNLNSTIQQLFEEKGAGNCKKGNGENSDHDAKEDDECLIKILKSA